MEKKLPDILIIAGPTGVGKSSAAVIAAEKLNGEIVSADSRQIYRGLIIGTAAPSSQLQQKIPHHLINVLDPREVWSAGAFADEAAAIIEDILARKLLPIVVGGSGFYIKALTGGLFKEPEADSAEREKIRANLQKRLEKEGIQALHADLVLCDPEWAGQISSTDTQRILRGMEVFALYGKPLSLLQKENRSPPPVQANWCTLLLERERKDLYARLNRRVDKLLDSGWLGEAKSLMTARVPVDAPGLTGLGYDLLFEHLSGRISFDEAIDGICREHRNYAKRQFSWFRNLVAHRIHLDRDDGSEETASRILDAWRKYLDGALEVS